MKRLFSIILFSFLALVLFSCNEDAHLVPSNSMVFPDNVSFVKEFPKTIALKEGEIMESGFPSHFYILDSIIFIQRTGVSEGMFCGFTYPGLEVIGKFVDMGNGSGQLSQWPDISFGGAIVTESDGHSLVLPDGRGDILKFDIEESLRRSENVVETVQEDVSPMAFSYTYIDDDTYMIVDEPGNTLERRVVRNGSDVTSPVLKALNQRAVIHSPNEENMSLYMAYREYSCDHDRMIEVLPCLNAINIYSIDGSYAKSVCIDNDVDNIDTLQTREMYNYVMQFQGLRLYDDFFVVNYLGDTLLSIESTRDKTPQLMLFDYDGEPKALVKIPYHIVGFEFDVKGGLLYVTDDENLDVHRYDVSRIL